MELHVFALVLLAAACHAGWNAVIKLNADPFLAAALIAVTGGIAALPVLPFSGLPAAEALPWLAASVLLHVAYFTGLAEAYRAGDMAQVYPLARGSAPLITAAVMGAGLGETLGVVGYAGIGLLAGGVVFMSFRGGSGAALNRRAVGFALFTALIIAGYSVVDGIGARVSGNAHAYAAMLFVLDGVALLALALLRRGNAMWSAFARNSGRVFAGGALSYVAYWIVIWAMTVAPIALVAALRETSVLFAAAIAVFVLREKLNAPRIAAALMMLAGLVLIRLH